MAVAKMARQAYKKRADRRWKPEAGSKSRCEASTSDGSWPILLGYPPSINPTHNATAATWTAGRADMLTASYERGRIHEREQAATGQRRALTTTGPCDPASGLPSGLLQDRLSGTCPNVRKNVQAPATTTDRGNRVRLY
jgi:hypothetical protein